MLKSHLVAKLNNLLFDVVANIYKKIIETWFFKACIFKKTTCSSSNFFCKSGFKVLFILLIKKV